ncbi:MAG: tRNA pseudouridine(38-40) synthase TruA [Fusobacteriaceae bacterium]
MKNIKLIYSYDGTDYFGFQKQPRTRTVQGELEKALKKLTKEEINLTSSGRTDRGVHANMQVSNFLTHSKIPPEKFCKILNKALPLDICIKSSGEEDLSFNSRFNAKKRVYRYYLTEERNPFKNRYETFIPFKVVLEDFLKIMEPLKGRHDFKNFRLADCSSKNQIREIFSIKGEYTSKNSFYIEIKGNSFLKSQIRMIIGTALAIYTENFPKNYFKELLKNPERIPVRLVADPNGLSLWEIIYEED